MFQQFVKINFAAAEQKELSLNQKNKGAAIEKPLFVVQGCIEMKYFQDTIHETGISSDGKCDHNEVDE